MKDAEFIESIRKKLTAGMSEITPLVGQFMDIITSAYEKGFWTGFNIGLSVEPKEDEK